MSICKFIHFSKPNYTLLGLIEELYLSQQQKQIEYFQYLEKQIEYVVFLN